MHLSCQKIVKQEKEEWLPVIGFEGHYLVSNQGRVKSTKFGRVRVLVNKTMRGGYKYVTLCKPKHKPKHYKVYRLAALAFLPNPNNYPMVNHIDGDTGNNHINNLEWCTAKHNSRHAVKIGHIKVKSITNSIYDATTVDRVLFLRNKGFTNSAIRYVLNVSPRTIVKIIKENDAA